MRPLVFRSLFTLLLCSTLAFGYGFYQEHILEQKLVAQAAAMGKRLSAYDQQLAQSARAMGRGIGYFVYQNRNQPRDIVVQQQAELIIKRADSLADSLTAPVSAGQLTALAHHLDRYVTFIRQYAPDAPSLTQPGGGLPQATDFHAYYFLKLPATSIRANLARLRTTVRRFEVDALSEQAQKIGSHCICFDKWGALAIPVSGTVAPGGIYEAQLMLAEYSAGFNNEQMSVNGLPVRKFEGAHGLVEIAIPNSFTDQADTLRTEWQGLIRTSTYPADTTWQLTVPYLVINKQKP